VTFPYPRALSLNGNKYFAEAGMGHGAIIQNCDLNYKG
jgi:hypothetical protein